MHLRGISSSSEEVHMSGVDCNNLCDIPRSLRQEDLRRLTRWLQEQRQAVSSNQFINTRTSRVSHSEYDFRNLSPRQLLVPLRRNRDVIARRRWHRVKSALLHPSSCHGFPGRLQEDSKPYQDSTTSTRFCFNVRNFLRQKSDNVNSRKYSL